VPSKSNSGIARLGGGKLYIIITSTSNFSKTIMFRKEENHLVTKKLRNMNYTKNLMI
jgi:hypothetical protein